MARASPTAVQFSMTRRNASIDCHLNHVQFEKGEWIWLSCVITS
jgi:hypothetical protein